MIDSAIIVQIAKEKLGKQRASGQRKVLNKSGSGGLVSVSMVDTPRGEINGWNAQFQ